MTSVDNGLTPDKVSPAAQSQRKAHHGGKHPRRLVHKIGITILGLTLISGAFAAVLAYQISSVKNQLIYVTDLIPQLRADFVNGNHDNARLTFETMHKETSAARSITTGPLWQGATFIPFVGANFTAVREVAVSADDIAALAVAPLMDKYGALGWDAITLTDGRLNVDEIQEAAPSIEAAANTVRLSYQRMESINVAGIVPQLAQPIRAANDQLQALTDVLSAASSAAQLVPAMLGSEGPRDYLVLIQNNAEARATGGIPGALAILHADDGRITLADQTSAVALGSFRPMVDVDPEQIAIYTERIGTQMQNVNLTPHFPTAAQSAKQMWEERHPDQTVDGVLALDPVVLSHLLQATGPLNLADAQVLNRIRDTELPSSLTQDNVVPTLLSEVYREIEVPEEQDAYFAAVAARVFSAFTEGQGDGEQLAKALRASAKENRLYLWSARASEQTIIASTSLHGSVTDWRAGGASFGLYINDGTGAKMDYYASRTVQLLQTCQQGEYDEYTVRMTVTNNAPSDAAAVLPAYVTGNGVFGVEPGRIRTNYVVYGPYQSFIEAAAVDGQTVPASSGRHGQRPVGTVQLELGPGETATLDVVFSRVVQNSEPQLNVTPSVQSLDDVVLPFKEEICG